MMGLRLTDGVNWPSPEQFGDSRLTLNSQWLNVFKKEEWLVATDSRLATTLEGRLRLDTILGHLLD